MWRQLWSSSRCRWLRPPMHDTAGPIVFPMANSLAHSGTFPSSVVLIQVVTPTLSVAPSARQAAPMQSRPDWFFPSAMYFTCFSQICKFTNSTIRTLALGHYARQCAANSLMTAERACDCVSGYIGNTSYGVDAGELSAREGRRVGGAACQIAANRAAAVNRPRHQAQLGPSQMCAPRGARRGFLTLPAAADAGFK